MCLCVTCVYNISSCGQWDGVELPLCEAFHRRDSWGSPETTSDPSHANPEDSDHLGTQESMHGSSTSEQSWNTGSFLYGPVRLHGQATCHLNKPRRKPPAVDCKSRVLELMWFFFFFSCKNDTELILRSFLMSNISVL